MLQGVSGWRRGKCAVVIRIGVRVVSNLGNSGEIHERVRAKIASPRVASTRNFAHTRVHACISLCPLTARKVFQKKKSQIFLIFRCLLKGQCHAIVALPYKLKLVFA